MRIFAYLGGKGG